MKTQILIEYGPDDDTVETFRRAAIVALTTGHNVQVKRETDEIPPDIVPFFELLSFAISPQEYRRVRQVPAEVPPIPTTLASGNQGTSDTERASR